MSSVKRPAQALGNVRAPLRPKRDLIREMADAAEGDEHPPTCVPNRVAVHAYPPRQLDRRGCPEHHPP